jgi:hypothetical protein
VSRRRHISTEIVSHQVVSGLAVRIKRRPDPKETSASETA